MSSPHKDKKMRASMLPHMFDSIESAQVALIGDVDLIDDAFWIDEKSSDKNPYSAVYKAANMELLRNLIDSMLQVKAYRDLPLRKAGNFMSIGQQIYNGIYNIYAPRYLEISGKIIELKNKIYAANNNINKAEALMNAGKAGEQSAELEKQADAILYQFKSDYNSAIRKMMFLNIVAVPIAMAFVLWLAVLLFASRKLKKIRELFDE
jgi:hypothetical protein